MEKLERIISFMIFFVLIVAGSLIGFLIFWLVNSMILPLFGA